MGPLGPISPLGLIGPISLIGLISPIFFFGDRRLFFFLLCNQVESRTPLGLFCLPRSRNRLVACLSKNPVGLWVLGPSRESYAA